MKLTEKTSTRNVGIDILRGCSILLVVLLHLNIRFKFSETFLKEVLPAKMFSFLFWSGFYGVVVFFTLSGYLITSSILKKWKNLSSIDLKAFYWLRFSRIIPPLLLLLIILSILHLAEVPGFVIKAEQASLGRAIFAALTFHLNWLEIQVGYLPANWDVLWSISVEETFYLLFPILCFFQKRKWQFAALLIAFLIISPWARTQLFLESDLADKNHLAFLDSIALGCMTALIVNKLTIPSWLNRPFLVIGWSMVIMVFVFKRFVYQSGLVDLGLNITVLSMGVSLILFWMHERHHSGNEKNYKLLGWLRTMGIYSYEIYLTHMFVIVFGVQIYKNLDLADHWLVPFSLLLVILSYFLGKLFFHGFSEPMNLWLRKRRTVNGS